VEALAEHTLVLLMHAGDSVALAPVDLPAGSTVRAGADLLMVRQDIPFGHKLAVRRHAAGDAIYKYGQKRYLSY
jgi:hypothetical protein